MTAGDPHRELVQRVVGSATFERSRAARAFLVYVCERALEPEPRPPSEVDIAAAVLESAQPGGQSGAVVRAQASQVRKKLQQYFAGEGAAEPVVLELPVGGYLPMFRPRDVRDTEPAIARRLRPAVPWIVAALGAALAMGTLLRPPERPRLSPPRPAVERLWRQMFDNGRPTTLLLADVNVAQVQDLLGQSLLLPEYSRDRLNARVEEHIADREIRLRALHTMDRRHTTMADVTVASRVLRLHAELGLAAADPILARDAAPRHFEQHNVILSGPRRANPWLDLFEPRLNFRSRFDEATKRSSFENRAARPGEQATYAAVWTQQGYCRLAYLPLGDGRGTALLLSGTDLTASEAGVEFITSEPRVQELLSRLGVPGGAPVPYFEVLLGSKVVLSRTSSHDLIAFRVIPAP